MAKMRWSKLEWQRKALTHQPLADPHLSVPTERQRQIQQTKKKSKSKRKRLQAPSQKPKPTLRSGQESRVIVGTSLFSNTATREIGLGAHVHARADASRHAVVVSTFKTRSGKVVGYLVTWHDGTTERVDPEEIEDEIRSSARMATASGNAQPARQETAKRFPSRASGGSKGKRRVSVWTMSGGAPSLRKRR
jgi:hypothetical protein